MNTFKLNIQDVVELFFNNSITCEYIPLCTYSPNSGDLKNKVCGSKEVSIGNDKLTWRCQNCKDFTNSVLIEKKTHFL